ncbi:hypothetical protein [Elongatibacter sediminis]|uniref:hypothetical protein n=1 Tax=Elongatibacter sediminis TaxID=3119006 RepID=UPI00339D7BD4
MFKYTIYCLLALNVYLFFQEEILSAREVFGADIAWGQLTEAFSATIDTAAWVVLLLLFELETAVIPDEKLRGGLKWALLAVRTVSYAFILWAFYGYVFKYGYLSHTVPFSVENLCGLVDAGYTWVEDLDQYPSLDLAACAALQGEALLRIDGTQIIGTGEALRAIQNLALVDIINAGDWLIIVVLLELEVLLQLKGRLTARRLRITKGIAGVLYAILFFCAIYWGVLGDFLDFWDAFLWLVAFIFIEMNIFQWHEETEELKGATNDPEGSGSEAAPAAGKGAV